MPPKPTKRKTPAAQTAGVPSVQSQSTNERSEPMNSIPASKNEPALSFSLEDFQLRAFIEEGEPKFVATDVASALGYQSAKDMTRLLDDDEKGRHIVPTLGGQQEVLVITEAGLYSAILKSRRPEAKRFKRWVTHDVLPSIRKTGGYSLKKQVPFDRQIARCQSLVLQIVRCDDIFGRQALVQLAKVAYAEIGQQLPDVALLPVLVSASDNQPSLDLVGGAV